MAYIDDNNDLAAGKGKDPIEKSDDELERLLTELKALDPDAEPENAASDSGADILAEPVGDPDDAEESQQMTKKKKKHAKAPLITSLILLVIVIAGFVWIANKLWNLRIFPQNKSESTAETEQFYDPLLGVTPVTRVSEDEQNTYDIGNLVKNDRGYYEYYEDGVKVSEIGVDLSAHQGEVDFEKIKSCGVDFVILRVGGRYYSDEGDLYADEQFDTYYQQARAAGLKIGAYFFSQAASVDDAVEEARFVINKLDGRTLDYPVAFDWETIEDDDARTDNLDGATITAMAEAFCDTIEDAGYPSLVYASTSLMLQSYDFTTMQDYDFWLADYREFPNMYYDFVMWQYQTDGSVDGIEGGADLNICFKPY